MFCSRKGNRGLGTIKAAYQRVHGCVVSILSRGAEWPETGLSLGATVAFSM